MVIVFCSNFMNHHQYFLSQEFIALGAEFYFVAVGTLPKEQERLGYHTYDDDFIIPYNDANKKHVSELMLSADAVIFGTKPMELYRMRVNSGKLTFNFSERLFKKSKLQELIGGMQPKLKKKYLVNKENPPYVLCAGSYVASDYARIGYPKDRFLKWGYFPDIPTESFEEIKSKKERNSIIWVGRFIPLKHPEYVIELAEYLREHNKTFTIKMIGVGELFEDVKRVIEEKNLGDAVQLMGSMAPEQVLEMFRSSEIALITSDRHEGWGAVVNEALGSGCVAVACKQMGSVSYLIKQNENGLVYEYGKKKVFFEEVSNILDNPDEKDRIAYNAYQSIQNLWNYKVAAKRLLEFVEKRESYADEGPISKE